MKNPIVPIMISSIILLSACSKTNITSEISGALGSWYQIQTPSGCNVKQIATDSKSGLVILCQDGRLFR